jgi:hypothetical protein
LLCFVCIWKSNDPIGVSPFHARDARPESSRMRGAARIHPLAAIRTE